LIQHGKEAGLSGTSPHADRLFSQQTGTKLMLLVKGTPYQIKVWEALLRIPFGEHLLPGSIGAYPKSTGSPGHRSCRGKKTGGLPDSLSPGGSKDRRNQWQPMGIGSKIGHDRMGGGSTLAALKLVCIHTFSS